MNGLQLGMRKFSSFWSLDGVVKLQILQALFWLPVVTLSLKWWGFKSTQARLCQLLPLRETVETGEDLVYRVLKVNQAVRLAAKYCQPWAKCLQQSLVLWSLLRHQGIDGQLRIGVQQKQGEFSAHAWVEWQGWAINDTQDVRDRYAAFEQLLETPLSTSE
jgi:hypothetical protein